MVFTLLTSTAKMSLSISYYVTTCLLEPFVLLMKQQKMIEILICMLSDLFFCPLRVHHSLTDML